MKKRKIEAITAFKVIQGHRGRYQSKARRGLCDFLLVINSNWHPISYRFGVIAAYCTNFAPTRSLWLKISGTRGCLPPIIFARLVRPMNALQLAADSFHTKKLCSRLSSSEVLFCVFETPFGGLRGNVGRSSWARWKASIRLPISVNWTFFARCYGWGATSDYWLKLGDFVPTGVGWPKISRRRGLPPPTILLLRKLG